MAILTQNLFTNKSDIVVSTSGWEVLLGITIDALNGNDSIIGSSSGGSYNYGIDNKGSIDTGNGNDNINGSGSGTGNSSNYGIYNTGSIDTGNGNDSITGSGSGSDSYYNYGIYSSGSIDTGEGNDTVNALVGGFGGSGTTNLGIDNDTLKGFGSGNFNGGDGTDKILFGEGSYTISDGVINGIMNVTSFEAIGGANGGLFTFANGTLTVTDGIGTFV